MRKRRRHSGGFTLVETLAAGMILALGAAALSVGARQALRAVRMSRDLQTAAALADEVLTKIDTLGPARLLDEQCTAGAFPPPYERFDWTAEIVPMTDGDLYDVTVSIRWRTSAGGRRDATIQTLLRDPAGSHPSVLAWEDL